jgi:voltage-gated potassium channel Kch
MAGGGMRPTVVVLGFVLGSAAAISFALAGTTVVFLTLRSEYPRLEGELGRLLISALLFCALTAVAGSSFYGEVKERPWRRTAQLGLLVTLAAVVAYHAWLR